MEKKDAVSVMYRLNGAGFKAYIVGGAVRDEELGLDVKDYDLVTDAVPEEIVGIFTGSKIVNASFSTIVTVPTGNGGHIDVSTMMMPVGYSNGRPTSWKYTNDINTDLARRDLTINAIAVDVEGGIIDPFGGMKDLSDRKIRSVGSAEVRIKEHPIRMLRAKRFAAGLGFEVVPELESAIKRNRRILAIEGWEAISAEFMKGLSVGPVVTYIHTLRSSGLLRVFIPELLLLADQEQNIHHGGSVWMHTLHSLFNTSGDRPLVRLAVLLHDVGKPATALLKTDDYGYSFKGHESVGADMAEEICVRLRMPKEDVALVRLAVQMHMHDISSERSAKRFLRKIDRGKGKDHVRRTADFILSVMEADRLGKPGASATEPFAGREFVESVLDKEEPFSVSDLKIDGHDVMALGVKQGPIVGEVLRRVAGLVADGEVANEMGPLVAVCNILISSGELGSDK